jgi:cytochrome c oxidase assembly protein subunit 15
LTPPLRSHALIEFGNRVVVTLLVVAAALTVVAALRRRPARRDLRWLSFGLALGVVAEALVGAVVVYSKLNAYVVVGHFVVGITLLAVATVLTLRAGHGAGPGTPVVSIGTLRTTRAFLVLLGAAIVAGAMTTGAGPHAGGKGAKRIPVALVDMTRVHGELVLATVAVLLAAMWMLWRADAPARVQDASRVLLAVMAAQGIVGYTQYFTHLPAVLVGVHVFGASMVWVLALWFHHRLSDHAAEPVRPEPAVPPATAAAASATMAAPGPALAEPAEPEIAVREPA